MKKLKILSIICSILGLLISLFGLFLGYIGINSTGWGMVLILLIPPSVIVLILVLFDFLITIDKIKKGLIYSLISSLIKIGTMIIFLPYAIYDLKNEIEFGASNYQLYLVAYIIIIIITIPSIINIIKLRKRNSLNLIP